MTPRSLAVGWILLVVVFVILLGVEFSKWRSITTEQARAAAERLRLANEIQLKEAELVAEMRRRSGLVQEMQWTSTGADPSVFLTRLADLAGEKRMTIMAVGPIERQVSPQFTKSWHSIQVRAPYREIRELATRVEQDRGVLEDLRIDAAPGAAGQSTGPPGPGELQARFKLTALELSPQTKLIVQKTLAAGSATGKVLPGSPLALSVPATSKGGPDGRDPFAFLTPPAPPGPPPGQLGPSSPLPDLGVRGIVSFPDGFLAIVNNQIVKVGDTVSGYRITQITENTVTFTRSGAPPRTIELPELAPGPSTGPPSATAPPRR